MKLHSRSYGSVVSEKELFVFRRSITRDSKILRTPALNVSIIMNPAAGRAPRERDVEKNEGLKKNGKGTERKRYRGTL